MTIALVADAACDLPKSYIAANHIEILPIHLRFGNQAATDVRDPNLAMRFYRTYIEHKDIDAETTPFSPQETAAFFKRLIGRYDHILCICISSERSKIYDNAVQAVRLLKLPDAESRLHVLDSNALFAGEAVVVAAAVEMIEQGATFDQLVRGVRSLSSIVQGYFVPEDLYYIRARARKRGDNSVGFLQYLAGQALDVKPIIHAHGVHTEVVEKVRGFERAMTTIFAKAVGIIKEGISVPVLAMSYAGNPQEVVGFPGYDELAAVAEAHGVQLLISVMSPTGGVYLGPGAFTLGFLPKAAA